MKRKKTSSIWDHILEEGEKFQCKYCSTIFSKKSSTSTLIYHMRKAHENLEITDSPKKKRNELKEPYLETRIHEKATNDLLNFIIDDYQAFNIVENEFFKIFLKNFNYEPPGRSYVKNQIMKIYQEKKKIIIDYLTKLDCLISLTFDLWTSNSNIPYLGITAHWIDTEWHICSISLDFIECPYPHDGEALASLVFSIIKEFEIVSKILGITTDNASNMQTFYDSFYEKIKVFSPFTTNFGCGCHIINLAVQNGINEIIPKIEKLRDINKKLKDSPKLFQEFKEVYDHFKPNFPFKTPKLDVKTRWNSLYYMIHDSIEMKEIYNKLNQTKLSEDEWNLISEFKDFLELFEQATNFISGNKYSTISVLFKITNILYYETKDYKTNNITIKNAALKMFDYFDKYWGELKLSGLIATFLDPRFKNDILNTYSGVKDQISTLYSYYNSIHNFSQNQKVNEKRSKYSKLNLNISLNDQEILNDNNFKEIELYINHIFSKTINIDDFDLLQWWKLHSQDFPILSKIARNYLAIQSSSVLSENLFSGAGNTITESRNRLSPDTSRAVVCLKSWNIFLNKS